MCFAFNFQLESLPAMVAGVYSDDRTLQLEATTQFRKLLSIGIERLIFYLFWFFFSWYCSFCFWNQFNHECYLNIIDFNCIN